MRTWNAGAGTWPVTEDRKFMYHGWLPILELDALNDDEVLRAYTWGLDLSGSLDGLAGVGGLLAVKAPEALPSGGNLNALYMHDAGGNVGQLVAWTSGFGEALNNDWYACRLVARYEYDPYGRIVGPDTNSDGKFDEQDDPGFYTAANPFRWSTKRFDPETGLSDFGMRYYSGTLGRWINRDPIGDLGGANVYAYVGNNPTNRTDYLGMMWAICLPGEVCGPSPGGDDPPQEKEEEDKKPCPRDRVPTPPVSPFGGVRECSEARCNYELDMARRVNEERGGSTAGKTVCENGKPCTCVFPAARMEGLVSDKTAQDVLEECVQAHENVHLLQKDLSGECRGGAKPPPWNRDECTAWTSHFTCLANSASKCGSDSTCYAQLLDAAKALRAGCEVQCKTPKYGFEDCDSNYKHAVRTIEKLQRTRP